MHACYPVHPETPVVVESTVPVPDNTCSIRRGCISGRQMDLGVSTLHVSFVVSASRFVPFPNWLRTKHIPLSPSPPLPALPRARPRWEQKELDA